MKKKSDHTRRVIKTSRIPNSFKAEIFIVVFTLSAEQTSQQTGQPVKDSPGKTIIMMFEEHHLSLCTPHCTIFDFLPLVLDLGDDAVVMHTHQSSLRVGRLALCVCSIKKEGEQWAHGPGRLRHWALVVSGCNVHTVQLREYDCKTWKSLPLFHFDWADVLVCSIKKMIHDWTWSYLSTIFTILWQQIPGEQFNQCVAVCFHWTVTKTDIFRPHCGF